MTKDKPSNLPYNGLKVIALEQAVAAPFCSRQLADMGAEVVKVERVDGGDFARGYGSALNGTSAYFAWLNRGKKSITLNLKDKEGLVAFRKLLSTTDVFIHNLSPGAIERMGFGYEPMKKAFPQLIWCSISGYGAGGPYQNKKAYDMLIQAESGVISLTGNEDEPAKVGISIADISSGLYAYSAIQTALWNRTKTNKGSRIDISMLECLVEWTMAPAYVWHGTQKAPQRAGIRHNMIVPYGAYNCQDGTVMFAIQNEREWKRFCEIVLQQPTICTDPRYASNQARLANRVALETYIEGCFSNLKRQEVINRLEEASIANANLNEVADLFDHPQLQARNRWVEVQTEHGTIPAFIPPFNIKGVNPLMGNIPALGEHTELILAELKEA